MKKFALFILVLLSGLNLVFGQGQLESKKGVLIHKDWTKTKESYEVGGSDYFVLCDLDKVEKMDTTGKSTCPEGVGLPLKETEKISKDSMMAFVGKYMEIVGEYKENQSPSAIIKEHPHEQIVEQRMVDSLPGSAKRFEVVEIREISKIVSNTITIERTYPASATLPPDFTKEFDRLFLSTEPLRYQENTRFLDLIELERLSEAERSLLRERLISFLHASGPDGFLSHREIAPDSLHTGVASEFATLRLRTVDLLGEIGEQPDLSFLESLCKKGLKPPGEHPLFKGRCKKAMKSIQRRK